jgi:hypothetical protein
VERRLEVEVFNPAQIAKKLGICQVTVYRIPMEADAGAGA